MGIEEDAGLDRVDRQDVVFLVSVVFTQSEGRSLPVDSVGAGGDAELLLFVAVVTSVEEFRGPLVVDDTGVEDESQCLPRTIGFEDPADTLGRVQRAHDVAGLCRIEQGIIDEELATGADRRGLGSLVISRPDGSSPSGCGSSQSGLQKTSSIGVHVQLSLSRFLGAS